MIIITGATGFIGSVLLAHLNSLGHEDIILVDKLGHGEKWKNICNLRFADIIEPEELFTNNFKPTLAHVTEIYHLGACSSTTETDSDYLMNNNFRYSQKIFHLASQRSIKLIYASSAATYGDGESGYDDRHNFSHQLRPLNAYGFSKKIFDDWALIQKESPPVWFGVKFFNVFGPNEYHKEGMRSVAMQAFEQITRFQKVKLFKSYRNDFAHGEQRRDFIYVWDAVKALVELMNVNKKHFSGLINLGTGQAHTFNELVEPVFKALDIPGNIEYVDMPEILQAKYQYFTEANMDKFKRICPEFRFQTLEESVIDYVTNYLNKENPYVSVYNNKQKKGRLL